METPIHDTYISSARLAYDFDLEKADSQDEFDLEKADSHDEFNLETGEHIDKTMKDMCWKWMRNFIDIFTSQTDSER